MPGCSWSTRSRSYQQQLRAAEKRRADFRARYIEILPTISAPGVPALEAARNNVAGLDGKLQDLILARDALKDEVDKTPPMLVAETAARQATAAQNTRLQQAQDQLRMLLLKDTDQHPDVIAQKKLIEFSEDRTARAGGDAEGGRGRGVRASEPVGAQPGL